MKALVTGATGFIGSHLAEALVKKGYALTCLVRKNSDLGWIERLNPEYIYGDLMDMDIESCADRFRGFDYIFHVAGLTKAVNEADFYAANAGCTARLLKVVADNAAGLRRFVYISSLAAAGPVFGDGPVDENSPPRPVSAYGKSKRKGEEAVKDFTGRVPSTIIRPPAVFGPRDKDFLVMFKMISRGAFPYWGKSLYSMLYVDDLVRGIILAAESDRGEGRLFFLSYPAVFSNEDIAGEISDALGVKAVRIRIPRLLFPVLGFIGQKFDKKGIINRDRLIDFGYTNWTCSTRLAESELGFMAKTSLREGIKWTADWYKTHQWI
ncbi:MAG: NAD-dependent epimerase/dehydratase family protein [Nitrospirae bacterium]|nr:NAD-dependent epimerase/dehydratase family protein [Nitrospirota bacterium]